MNFILGIALGQDKKNNSKQDRLDRPFPPRGDKQEEVNQKLRQLKLLVFFIKTFKNQDDMIDGSLRMLEISLWKGQVGEFSPGGDPWDKPERYRVGLCQGRTQCLPQSLPTLGHWWSPVNEWTQTNRSAQTQLWDGVPLKKKKHLSKVSISRRQQHLF